ncbi:hypothetical protein KR222_006330 [Zaprionus bogoriensis]|nr:hypothetical protein KR222_006330 [Zaprionus bogoriensis]
MTEKANSEDEFQDALSDTSPSLQKVTSASPENDKLIDDIIEKNSSLRLDDDTEAEGAAGGTKEGAGDVADEKEGDTEKEEELEPDGELTIEQLLALEKDLSPEALEANKEKAEKLKLEGNELFKAEQAERAVEIYTEALNICPSKNSKERAVLFGNRAAAKLKLGSVKLAIDDCTKAIELYPEYVRALLRLVMCGDMRDEPRLVIPFVLNRRAKLYEQDEKLDEALADYKRVSEIDPGQREAREAQVRLPPLINARNEKLKNEMMSSLKDLGNMILRPFGLSTANFQMQQDPSGSYSINFNQSKS